MSRCLEIWTYLAAQEDALVAPGRSDEYVVPEILVHEAGN
jgi:hypothetical protein